VKLKTLKPLYLGGQVLPEGRSFETIEQHGRELITKGYAEADSSDDETVVTLENEGGAPVGVLTSGSLDISPEKPEPAKKTAELAKKKGA
jgi:sugar/nucleoside kinase (ribokinase family)